MLSIVILMGLSSILLFVAISYILSLQNQLAELRIKRNVKDTLSTLSFMLSEESICTNNLARLINGPLSQPVLSSTEFNVSDLDLKSQIVTAGMNLPSNSNIFVQSLKLNNFQTFLPGRIYTADLLFDGELQANNGRISRNADFKVTMLLQTLNTSPLTFTRCVRIASDTNVNQILNDICVNYFEGSYATPNCTL